MDEGAFSLLACEWCVFVRQVIFRPEERGFGSAGDTIAPGEPAIEHLNPLSRRWQVVCIQRQRGREMLYLDGSREVRCSRFSVRTVREYLEYFLPRRLPVATKACK